MIVIYHTKLGLRTMIAPAHHAYRIYNTGEPVIPSESNGVLNIIFGMIARVPESPSIILVTIENSVITSLL